ncbi:MAG: MFS transporter, partial [Promethearchaeota archaeon]
TVPMSQIFWPEDAYHALEMGILITTLFWTSSITGIVFGRLIDKWSRKRILFVISIFRGFSMLMLAFAIEGEGLQTWWYFFIFIFIFASFAGGSYPAIVSIAHDVVPLNKRSQFFGIFGIIMSIFTMIGFLISGYLVQEGYWRFFFGGIGVAILLAGLILIFCVNEPKRGVLREELSDVLKGGAEYDFQIDRKTMRETMLSKTNVVALIEGIFTNVFLGSLNILILPFMMSEPHYFSPLAMGVFLVFFGLSGGLIGQILLARISDKFSAKNHARRLYFIVFALIAGMLSFIVMFFLPLPHLTIEQGKDIPHLFSLPVIWLMGIIFLSSSSISSLYSVNQGPILQEINLPEAQGQIVSWNQFLENIGYGAGPLIAGILISFSGQNYQMIALIIGVFSIPGIALWLIAVRWYPEDKKSISRILKERSESLNQKNNRIN